MAAAVSLSFFTLSLQLKAHIQCLLVSILSHYCFPKLSRNYPLYLTPAFRHTDSRNLLLHIFIPFSKILLYHSLFYNFPLYHHN